MSKNRTASTSTIPSLNLSQIQLLDRHKYAHCAMFIRMKCEEDEEYLMYMYPSLASSNIHAKSMEQLKGVFHAAYGGSVDVMESPLAFLHLIPSTGNNSAGPDRNSASSSASPHMFTLHDLPSPSSSQGSPSSKSKSLSHENQYNSIKASIERLRLELKKKQQLVVTYRLIHEDLMFILVLPHLHELFIANYMESLYGLLKFSFDSIDSVVFDPHAHADLDALFQRFFDNVLRPSQHTLRFMDTFSSSIPSLQCPLSLSQLIDNELNLLEANFHSKDLMKTPHICFILGTCLLHAGLLLSSHLTPKLTKKVVSFVQAMNHLQRKADSPEIITVHEIFYKEKTNPFGLVKPKSDGVTIQKKKYLLVVLCQGNQVLCNVLSPREHALNQQDPFYTNEMRLCLQRMHANNVFRMVDQCMARRNPPLADPSSFLVKPKPNKPIKSMPHTLTIDQSSLEILSSATTGPYNVLFNYVIHSQAQGTLLFPISLTDNLSRIEPIFIKYCGIIRQTLMLRRQSEYLVDEDFTKPERMSHAAERPILMEGTEPIVEYGIHVEDSESFAPHTIKYWVVGAMLPISSSTYGDLTEIYICYEDSIPQNIVDIAYRMATSIL